MGCDDFGMFFARVLIWSVAGMWLRGLGLLLLCGIFLIVLRRRSASVLHLVLSMAMLGLVLLPVAGIFPASPKSVNAGLLLPDHLLRNEKSYFLNRAFQLIPVAVAMPDPHPVMHIPVSTNRAGPPGRIPELSWYAADVVALVWLLGVLFLIARYLLSTWYMARIARLSRIAGGELAGVAGKVISEMEFSRKVRLLISEEIQIPVTGGITRPFIILPATAVQWARERYENVLRHELAHVRRWDTLTQALTELATATHWPNPLVWFMGARMRRERERACDDQVLASGVTPSAYAQDLVEFVTDRSHPTRRRGFVIAYCAEFPKRISAILDPARSRGGASAGTVMASAILCLVLVLATSFVTLSGPQAAVRAQSSKSTTDREAVLGQIIRNGNLAGATAMVHSHPELLMGHSGYNPLIMALNHRVRNGPQIAQMLISEGADVNFRWYMGWTALKEAAANGDVASVKLLLSKGANLNARDNYQRSALDDAAYFGHNEVAEVLINAGATNTALDAVLLEDVKRLRAFLDKDRSLVNSRTNMPPIDLMEAALLKKSRTGDAQMVEAILQYHPAIDFWKAAALGRGDLVSQYLREQPTLIDEQHDMGMTALDWAIAERDTRMASLLLAHGATATSKMLAAAVRSGNGDMVRLLVAHHADPNELIPGFGSPRGLALRLGRSDLAGIMK